METGKFYFLDDEYYNLFSDCNLCMNKGKNHGRPCYYCFEFDGFYWLIPISSKVDKYKKIYNDKMKRYKGNYDGIRFGYVNGKERAFLIQNICPVTEKFIKDKYTIEHGKVDVTVNKKFSKELNALARKVVRLYKNGKIITYTNINKIIEKLQIVKK